MSDAQRLFDLVARVDPAAEACSDPGRAISYADLAAEIDGVAADLIARGVKPGDRVGFLANPGIRFWAHFLGAVKAGAVWFGLNPKYKPAELARTISDAKPALVQYDPDLVDADGFAAMRNAYVCPIESLPAEPPLSRTPIKDHSDADVPCLLVFTSGSSGRPKGALINQKALIRAAEIRCAAWAKGPFRTLANLPINHIGCVGDHGCTTVFSGGMLAFQPRYDAAGGLDLIAEKKLNFFFQVPAQLEMALVQQDKQPRDLSSLSLVAWSGGAASEALVTNLDRRFPGRIATDYSSTESVGAITLTKPGTPADQLIGMAGFSVPERPLTLSDAGEVLIPVQDVFSGYLGNPEATEAALAVGYLHTGDIGEWRSSDGALRLVGRMSDMFKSGGYNVYPREIEIALESLPGITRAAVIAIPDDTWGEVGCAYIEVSQDALVTPETVIADREHLANYKVPKSVILLPTLPLLSIGKVDKKALAGFGLARV